MPRINLLPWREAERQDRQRDFMIAIAGAFVAAVIVATLANFVYIGRIDYQLARNARLEAEIIELDKSITEINGLERQKERLLARMEIIERLQSSRPEIVHLFDEMARQIPEGVYLTAMKQSGSTVEVTGVAQSSTRVSALMRQIDSSDWLTNPDVVKVETTDQGSSRQAGFVVTLNQVRASGEGTEDEG
ncbi:MAG: PilN domain-containing protein [Gammaproteobacteria bacterium]|nr:PilN domain-containing protein [Gammaproteobacteria bacterium]